MFELSIAGSPDIAPSPTTLEITGLCRMRGTHSYENEKGALKENEEHSNLLYKYDNVWEINLRSTAEVRVKLHVLASPWYLLHWYPQSPCPMAPAHQSPYLSLLERSHS